MASLLDLGSNGLLSSSTAGSTPVTTVLGGAAPVATVTAPIVGVVQVGSAGSAGAAASASAPIVIDLLAGLPGMTGGTVTTVTTPVAGVTVGSGTGTGTTPATTTTTPTATIAVTPGPLPADAADNDGVNGQPTAHQAYQNIFRVSAAEVSASISAQLDQLDAMVAGGQITAKAAVLQVVNAAAFVTAVPETLYQFFTGLTPSAAGLDYLVHSAANPADLSDSYYAGFNMENRYINFAANLGLQSDYAPGFAKDFGGLTFDGAVRLAYARIVGAPGAVPGVNTEAAITDIEARLPYFQQLAHERFGASNFDLSTKLAAVAYIMEEAVKANVGNYGEANQNFLYDLADGHAQFNVNLVGTYGHGTLLDVA